MGGVNRVVLEGVVEGVVERGNMGVLRLRGECS